MAVPGAVFLVMGYRGRLFLLGQGLWTTGTLALGRLQGLWHFHFGQRKEALGGSPAGLWCGFPADPTEILMAWSRLPRRCLSLGSCPFPQQSPSTLHFQTAAHRNSKKEPLQGPQPWCLGCFAQDWEGSAEGPVEKNIITSVSAESPDTPCSPLAPESVSYK